eukprot:scaffold29133_cov135-Isochrysis_galbana.AAC.5
MRRENDLPNKCTDTSPHIHIGRSREPLQLSPASLPARRRTSPERRSATARQRQQRADNCYAAITL